MSKQLPVAILFCSSAAWGLTWLPAKALLNLGLASQHFIAFAFGAGTLALLPILWRQRRVWRAQVWRLAAIGLVGGLSYVSFQTAIARGDTVRVMILFYLLPIWSVLGGRYFLQERVDAVRLLAVAICIGGAALTLNVGAATLLRPFDGIDALALLSGLTLAGTNLLFRGADSIPLASKVAAMYCGCTALITLSLLIIPPAAALPHNFAIPLAMLYGAVWITLLTFATQWAVTQLEVGRSALIIVVELVVAVISTALLTAHTLALWEWIGAALVLGAAVLEGVRPVNRRWTGTPDSGNRV